MPHRGGNTQRPRKRIRSKPFIGGQRSERLSIHTSVKGATPVPHWGGIIRMERPRERIRKNPSCKTSERSDTPSPEYFFHSSGLGIRTEGVLVSLIRLERDNMIKIYYIKRQARIWNFNIQLFGQSCYRKFDFWDAGPMEGRLVGPTVSFFFFFGS